MFRYQKKNKLSKFMYRFCCKKSKYDISALADKKKAKANQLERELYNLKSTGKAFILVDSPMACYNLYKAIL